MSVAAPLTQAAPSRTVRAALEQAAAALPGETPRLDAEVLLAQALGRSRAWLLAHATDPVPAESHAAFAAMLARRADGEPVAYIVGKAAFWRLELEVNAATLVPRADTETLVEHVLGCVTASDARVLDLGTGSGAIALALAQERQGWEVLGVDIDPAAVAVAARNAQRHVIANARFVAGDWYLPVVGMRFDVIVSNPPYIRTDDPCLQAIGLVREPLAALASGADGLDALRAVIDGALAHLVSGGLLACEHGAEQGAQVRSLFAQAGFIHVLTVRDLSGRERVTAGWSRCAGDGPAGEVTHDG
jgi:release factor glutamine methyltransferase